MATRSRTPSRGRVRSRSLSGAPEKDTRSGSSSRPQHGRPTSPARDEESGSQTRRRSISRSPRRSISPRSMSRSRSPSRSPRNDERRWPRNAVDSRGSGDYNATGNRSPRDRRNERSPGPAKSSKIVVEKLTKNVTESHLQEIFGVYGKIADLELPMNRHFNINRGTAYIIYGSTDAAEAAIAHMHEGQLDGAVIHVSIVLPRRKFSRSPPPSRRNQPPLRDGPPPRELDRPPPPRYGGPTNRFRSPPPQSRRASPPRRYGGPPPPREAHPGPRSMSRSRSPRRNRSQSYSSRSRSRTPRRYRRRESPPPQARRRRSPSYSSYSSRSRSRSRSRPRRGGR